MLREANMENSKLPFIILVLLVIGGIVIMVVLPDRPVQPEDPEYIEIQKAVQLYWEVRAEIPYKCDEIRLSGVMANDWRGGAICDGTWNCQKLVRWYRKKANLIGVGIGYLDYWKAVCAYNQEVNRIYEESRAIMREMPIPSYKQPDCNCGTPDAYSIAWYQLNALPEIKALKETTEYWDASPPREMPENWEYMPRYNRIESTMYDKFDPNIVHIVYGGGEGGKADMTLAKIWGRWYVINYRGR